MTRRAVDVLGLEPAAGEPGDGWPRRLPVLPAAGRASGPRPAPRPEPELVAAALSLRVVPELPRNPDGQRAINYSAMRIGRTPIRRHRRGAGTAGVAVVNGAGTAGCGDGPELARRGGHGRRRDVRGTGAVVGQQSRPRRDLATCGGRHRPRGGDDRADDSGPGRAGSRRGGPVCVVRRSARRRSRGPRAGGVRPRCRLVAGWQHTLGAAVAGALRGDVRRRDGVCLARIWSARRGAAVFAPLAAAVDVGSAAQVQVVEGHGGQFGDSQPGLRGQHEQRVVASAVPGGPVGGGE